jgi:DNA-binding response OmpR family regulator
MLTARGDEADRIVGLRLAPMPAQTFDCELLARLRRYRRTARWQVTMMTAKPSCRGPLRIDPNTRTAF